MTVFTRILTETDILTLFVLERTHECKIEAEENGIRCSRAALCLVLEWFKNAYVFFNPIIFSSF